MGSVVSRSKVKNKFALRLMPSLRQGAEAISALEGVSLNQFINVAIAEKVARTEHARWVAGRVPVTEAERQESLAFLSRLPDVPPVEGDELPAEYVEWRLRQGRVENGYDSDRSNSTAS